MQRAFFLLLACLCFATPAMADDALVLPEAIAKNVKAPLEEVGNGKYRKLGFSIYRAALWAPDAEFDKAKPYALQIRYTRSLSKETVVDAVVGDVRAQKMADEATMDQWQALLTETLPAVEEGDEIVGLAMPGKPARLYLNGKQIASIADKRLSDSFFNIWLGEVANGDLRAQLMGQG